MTETIISVRGEHSAWYPAERASVVVGISFDGPTREPVFAAATDALEAVRATVTPLHDPKAGPITWWSADGVRVWSQRPWNQEGVQLDPVHYAQLELTAKFSEFDALASWIESVVAIEGTTVASIEWSLTEARRTSVIAEVRSRAVKDAVSKASVYAQSIGLASVTATAIADPGMLGDSSSGGGIDGGPQLDRMMSKSSFDGAGGAPLALKPEQIEVSAVVDARFVAR